MIGDATQRVGEPGLRVDAVELRGLDQHQHRSGALAAAVGASEQRGLAADCGPAQRPLGGIVQARFRHGVTAERVRVPDRSGARRVFGRLFRVSPGGNQQAKGARVPALARKRRS